MKSYASKHTPANEGATFLQTSAAPLHHYTLATAPQLATICQVSRRSVDNWIRKKTIPVIRIGSNVRFHVPDVMAALAKFTVKEITL